MGEHVCVGIADGVYEHIEVVVTAGTSVLDAETASYAFHLWVSTQGPAQQELERLKQGTGASHAPHPGASADGADGVPNGAPSLTALTDQGGKAEGGKGRAEGERSTAGAPEPDSKEAMGSVLSLLGVLRGLEAAHHTVRGQDGVRKQEGCGVGASLQRVRLLQVGLACRV